MAGPTESFFEELGERGTEPLLHRAKGTLRFDLDHGTGTQRWFLTIDHGRLTVSRKGDRADSVCHASRALFDRLVTGEGNAMVAALRGLLRIEGDPELFVLFQRLLPGRPVAAAVPTQGVRS